MFASNRNNLHQAMICSSFDVLKGNFRLNIWLLEKIWQVFKSVHSEQNRFFYKLGIHFSALEPEIQYTKQTLFSQDHWEDLGQNKFSFSMVVGNFFQKYFTPTIFQIFWIFQDVLFLSILLKRLFREQSLKTW